MKHYMLSDVLKSKLVLITGKGGVGKTSFSCALGRALAQKQKKVLLVEFDNFNSVLEPIFSVKSTYKHEEIEPGLYVCNVTWQEALQDWLKQIVKIKTIVKRILNNKIAMIYLDVTPGAREIVILSKIIQFLKTYDHVIVDPPASGHALGVLKVPITAKKLMRAGPVYEKAVEILEVLSHQSTLPVVISLPEEMVVNETLELKQLFQRELPYLQKPQVVLNKASNSSFSKEEEVLLNVLSKEHDNSIYEPFVQAGLWESELERATDSALKKIERGYDQKALFLPRMGRLDTAENNSGQSHKKYPNNHRIVVEQMTSFIHRHL